MGIRTCGLGFEVYLVFRLLQLVFFCQFNGFPFPARFDLGPQPDAHNTRKCKRSNRALYKRFSKPFRKRLIELLSDFG